jgi:hypothetical protein
MLANEQLTTVELKELVLARDYNMQIAWHLAVRWGRVGVLDRLWEWAKRDLNRDELIMNSCWQR